MSTVDVIQSVGVIVTIIFSIIGIVQSKKSNELANTANNKADQANELSNQANDIAKEAIKDSKKDYMPLIRFVGKLEAKTKSLSTLMNENTFDFDDMLIKMLADEESQEYEQEEYEQKELVCIEATVENCGTGIIKGMMINSLFIEQGNKVMMDVRSQKEELDCLCDIKNKFKEWFILKPKEQVVINFLISKSLHFDVYNAENIYEDLDEAQNRIKEFFDDSNNIIIGMSLQLESVNNTCYNQDFLLGTALNKEIIHNSFEDVTESK